jgi:hypothetical protein
MRKTRFENDKIKLGYDFLGSGSWSFFVSEEEGGWEWNQVGPLYGSKAELLADAHRYATENWGF